jgi:hypothetical protein
VNPAELASLIRYYLSELGAKNAHHEFEHLARHLARARIASNILPATGPVGAGGDRGRDFETFETGTLEIGPSAAFAGRSSGKRKIVFACSVQKSIIPKIREDMTVVAGQKDVDELAYFCEANVPVAKRLTLVDEARQQGIVLQIFDGLAISEWLAESDIFWIAQEYLHLPSEIVPEGELEEGYAGHRANWKDRTPNRLNRTDFLAIKAGLRTATFQPEYRPDLNFWLGKMAAFLDDSPRHLARDAMYEISVANLRGKGDLTPARALVEDYFSDVTDHASIGEITDAVILQTYCTAAVGLNQFETQPEPLFARREMLDGLLGAWLVEPGIGPGRRSGLLRMRGTLQLTPKSFDTPPDLTLTIELWTQMLDEAAKAPLYPIEEFSDQIAGIIGFMGEVPELLELADRADELLASKAGNAAAGEKAIDRAFGLLDAGDIPAAIRELHKAKMKWFSGERLEGMLRLLLLIAEQYHQLGLLYAAKYHQLAAAYIARYEDPDRVGAILPKALLAVQDSEYGAGNMFGFLQIFPVLLVAHVQHDAKPLEMAEHPAMLENMGQIAALIGYLKRSNPDARALIDELSADWPDYIRKPIWDAADQPSGFWLAEPFEKVWTDLEGAMADRPYGDFGSRRTVSWEALGIDWKCSFANSFAVTPAAEQLIAELQIAACAFGGRDLGIVPASIRIDVAIDERIANREIEHEEGQAFVIRLPKTDRDANGIVDSAALMGAILHSCSALPDDRLMKVFDRSVLEPLFVGRPYAEMWREFVSEELFAENVRQGAGAIEQDRHFNSKAGERVHWFDGPGPTYDRELALLDVEHRYGKLLKSLGHTLVRLNQDEAAMARIRKLHEHGLKDWEILSILGNVAMNYRLEQEGIATHEEYQRRGMELMERSERPEQALDPAIFTDDALEMNRAMYLAAFLNGRQLRAPPISKFEGLEHFLVSRYRIREDDVPHGPIFEWHAAINLE